MAERWAHTGYAAALRVLSLCWLLTACWWGCTCLLSGPRLPSNTLCAAWGACGLFRCVGESRSGCARG